ncbi:hypothetical protein BGZ60DRAFT_126181 [Tricladium varicosporioides]|nr:hypothetical protein BGZ60DRAFT_126181 [Hymenoscyphus varicosporioides]
MTTAVENQHSHFYRSDEIYQESDYVPKPMSPNLSPKSVHRSPSTSPELDVPLPPRPASDHSSPSSSPNSKEVQKAKELDDAAVVHFMGNGQAPQVTRRVGNDRFAPDMEEEKTKSNGTHVEISILTEDTLEKKPEVAKDGGENDGLALATQAMSVIQKFAQSTSPELEKARVETELVKLDVMKKEDDQMDDVKPTIPAMNTIRYIESPHSHSSPDVAKPEIKSPGIGELPPIRHRSPHSGLLNGNSGPITLPSISDQLGDISHIPEPVPQGESPYAQSPPGRPPLRFGHGSPPKSPNDTFRRELPSPGRGAFFNYNTHRRPSQSEGIQYSSAGDYSSSNTETPSTDQSGATPAIDRMSIDGITNPQIGGFQCTYPGCTAQPFQTQYLLNSHANVHSSNRPHYCSVKGCPRSEGGKGFKRKNEMIRHGLVHDSPGYVCPFCPDREHKYPRPDNLQRHVRVHHVDKDKDDPQLRDVLSQRPEGPSRGRRRRGGTS